MTPIIRTAVFALLTVAAGATAAQAAPSQDPATELRIESAFSPEAGAEALVLKVIASAQKELRLAGYSFSSVKIAKALVAATQRGVDVRVVVDDKRNRNPSSVAALNLLVNAGIAVRTNAVYALHHDKYLVADARHVQNGSFNYTAGAASANSENVLVIWNDVDLATAFLQHWQSRWNQASAFAAK